MQTRLLVFSDHELRYQTPRYKLALGDISCSCIHVHQNTVDLAVAAVGYAHRRTTSAERRGFVQSTNAASSGH